MVIIGQIAPWKRQEDAVEAFSRLFREGRQAYLLIVGEAKFRQENEEYLISLKQKVKTLRLEDKVIFTGFREDVLEICCAADLLLLCSDMNPLAASLSKRCRKERRWWPPGEEAFRRLFKMA